MVVAAPADAEPNQLLLAVALPNRSDHVAAGLVEDNELRRPGNVDVLRAEDLALDRFGWPELLHRSQQPKDDRTHREVFAPGGALVVDGFESEFDGRWKRHCGSPLSVFERASTG